MSIDTPWGRSQGSPQIMGEGLAIYDTPGHGGVRVDASRAGEVHEELRPLCIEWADGTLWMEEDCVFAVAAVTWPEEFKRYDIEMAHQSLKNWSPHEYSRAFGVEVRIEESGLLQREEFERVHAEDLVTVAAWGSWDEHTPAGMVRVLAFRGGRLKNGSYPPGEPNRYFLVPKAEYDDRNRLGFIVDEARHEEIQLAAA